MPVDTASLALSEVVVSPLTVNADVLHHLGMSLAQVDGVQLPLIQICVWFGGVILSISLVRIAATFLASQAMSAARRRGEQNARAYSRNMSSDGSQSFSGFGSSSGTGSPGAGSSGSGSSSSSGSGSGPGSGSQTPPDSGFSLASLSGGSSPVSGLSGGAEDSASPTPGSVSLTDDGTVVADAGNSDTTAFVDESGVNTSTKSGDDGTPLTEKAGYLGSRVTDKVDSVTGGAASTAQLAGKEAYSQLPDTVRAGIALGGATARAYPELQKQPTVRETISTATEMANESDLFGSQPPPGGSHTDWDESVREQEGPPQILPMTPEEYTMLESASPGGSGDAVEVPGQSYRYMDDGEMVEVTPTDQFKQLTTAEQAEAVVPQVTDLSGFDRGGAGGIPSQQHMDRETFQRAQMAGHISRHFAQIKDPEVAAEMWSGLTVGNADAPASSLQGGTRYLPSEEALILSDATVERYRPFEHEMHHRLEDVSGLEYVQSQSPNGIHPKQVTSNYDTLRDGGRFVNFNFDAGVIEGDGFEQRAFTPQEAMLHVENSDGDLQPIGAAEWRDDVIEELEEDYGIEVPQSRLPGGRTDPIDESDEFHDETFEATRKLASEANKALFKQQEVINNATQTDSVVDGLAATRQMKETVIGHGGYSSTYAGETITRTGDVLQTPAGDDTIPPKTIKQLQDHHPDLVEAYREVYEVSDHVKQYLD